MRKIIYNEKIKKLLIGIVITAMVFNYILPLKVESVEGTTTVSFNQYVENAKQNIPEDTINLINTDTIIDYAEGTVEDFLTLANYGESKSMYYADRREQSKYAKTVLNKVFEKISNQVTAKKDLYDENANVNINEEIAYFLIDQGEKVFVTYSYNGDVSKVDISKADFSDCDIQPKTPESENDNKINEGIYSGDETTRGNYNCTANIAAKVWGQNYIYGIIQDHLFDIGRIGRKKDEYDWPRIFEEYGNNIDKMKVCFEEIDENGNPTGERPTIVNILTAITEEDLNKFPLPEGEEPTYYTELYEEENGSADLGGILLSPIFSLVNFVADAIVSGLGTIMMGEGSGFLGLGILSTQKPNTIYTNTSSRYVNTDSFLGIGSLKYQYPHITYTPEEIFAGQVPLLSIDFISGKVYDKSTGTTANELNKGWTSIRKVISQWYQVLRMIAIIGFLSVLIYTGIKIIISSNAKDKAKYKEWIINWLVGVAILFFMHYIMAFIISIIGEFSNLISSSFTGIHVIPSNNTENAFDTNLMGLVRFMIQSKNFYTKVGYEIMYIALIVYTIKFTFIYLKRVLNMAFLTLIAPIVALTYPIDKMNDGKAQGFDMWLKEYVFNALLQPMHCILYYVLVGTAIDVAVSNPIYAVVVLAFMTEAEKIFKKIFGFDKANPGTVGGMSSAFAAGAIASNVAKSISKFSKGNGKKGGNAGGNAQNNLLDNVKPLKDGPVEDNFQEDSLGGGNSANSANGNTTNANSNNGNTANGATVNANSNNGNTANGATANANSNNRNTTNGTSPTNNGGTATGKGTSVKNGFGNVKRKIKNLVKADDRGEGYNRRRWKRRLGKAAKGIGRFAVGATLGTAAAAVQAGISITDGKYSLKEGIASFAAGYAGGGKLTSGIGRAASSVSETFKEGYYEGDQGALREKQKEQFMDNDEIYKMYKNKYGEDAGKMQQLAADNMVPYGYTDVKEQFKIQKMANEIIKKNSQYDSYDDSQKQEYMQKALKQARNTKSFIDSPGISGIVHSPGKQEDYIKAEIKSRGITDENSQEAQTIRTGLQNAFKSAAVWQQVNK